MEFEIFMVGPGVVRAVASPRGQARLAGDPAPRFTPWQRRGGAAKGRKPSGLR